MEIFNYQTRLKQKKFFLKFGKLGTSISLTMILIGFMFPNRLIIFATVGQILLYLSVSSGIVFNRLGWSQNLLIDILFNQVSIILSVMGYVLVFLYVQCNYDESIMNIGILMIVVSFVFVWVGIKFHSPVQITD